MLGGRFDIRAIAFELDQIIAALAHDRLGGCMVGVARVEAD
jgi:hypothetical protein